MVETMQESCFCVSCSICTREPCSLWIIPALGLYQSITYLLGHLDFISLSHSDLHNKYHSVMVKYIDQGPLRKIQTLGVRRRNSIQKFDYTGDGRAKKQTENIEGT